MKLIISSVTILTILLLAPETISAQQNKRQPATARQAADSILTGVYRIDLTASDKLYSVVERASSDVPFGEQQRFFVDLTVRLTPPDLLAIERRGNRVTVGSSRSRQYTYVADGIARTERSASGHVVRSRIALSGDTLTFTSSGRTEDNVNVTFASLENGKRLRVTRRIYAEQLREPLVIQTVYNKISDTVQWDFYGERQIADQTIAENDAGASAAAPTQAATAQRRPAATAESNAADRLRSALDQWIEATNRRDIAGQMSFYLPELKAFYLARNVSAKAVRAEKTRVFAGANSIEIAAAEPEIIFQDNGRTAVMRFRKKYSIVNKSKSRSGEVVQELRWQQTGDGWRISSERDIRVIR